MAVPHGLALLRRRHGFRNARVKKLIFLGLDGLDPGLTERFLAEGKLPNLARLREQGGFAGCAPLFPRSRRWPGPPSPRESIPAKHNIFDFLNRNLKTYVPELVVGRVQHAARVLQNRPFRIPLSAPLRRAAPQEPSPSGSILGRAAHRLHHPPRAHHFPARSSTAGCSRPCPRPDLRGTQGSFSQFTTRLREADIRGRQPLSAASVDGDSLEGELEGPENASRRRRRAPCGSRSALLHADGQWALARNQGRDAIRSRPGGIHAVDSRCASRRPRHHRARHRALPADRRPDPKFRSTSRPSRSIPKSPRCPSAIRRTTPPTWPSCWARSPRSAWPKIPGR